MIFGSLDPRCEPGRFSSPMPKSGDLALWQWHVFALFAYNKPTATRKVKLDLLNGKIFGHDF